MESRELGDVHRVGRVDLKDGAGAVATEEHRIGQHAELGRRRRKLPPDDRLVLLVLVWVLCDEITLHASVDGAYLATVGVADQCHRRQQQSEVWGVLLLELFAVGRAEGLVQLRVERRRARVPRSGH